MKKLLILMFLLPLSLRAETLCVGDSVTKGVPYVNPGEEFCKGVNLGVGGSIASSGEVTGKYKNVVIMYGLNDAYYQVPLKEYESSLIRMIKRAGLKRAILMTSNPYFRNREENLKLYPYILSVRRISKKYKIPLVDNYQVFSELGMKEDLSKYYKDELHPNALGHAVILGELNGKLKR